MHELIAFLTARYDEAERLISYAGPARIAWLTLFRPDGQLDYTTVAAALGDESGWCADGKVMREASVVRVIYDPAQRRADIALKRAILAEHKHAKSEWPGTPDFGCQICHYHDEYGQQGYGWCATVRQLGTEFAGHPDYDESWKP